MMKTHFISLNLNLSYIMGSHADSAQPTRQGTDRSNTNQPCINPVRLFTLGQQSVLLQNLPSLV